MPEGTTAYPRWEGVLRTGSAMPVIIGQEVRRALNSWWIWVAITVFAMMQLFFTQQKEHTKNFIQFVEDIRWLGLAVAAITAGPAFLDDQRRGALELYMARAVTKSDYIWGKILAVFGLTTVLMWLPALATYLSSFLVASDHPADWNLAPWQALLYCLMWSILVSSLGLGLSCISRSSRAAMVILFGSFAALDIVIRHLMSGITNDPTYALLSPFVAMKQQESWIFGIPDPYPIPVVYGLLEWLVLVGIGIALVWWKRPRVRGDEPVRA
jgi:ABC-type transport system involved in multi-copper enzyme maturation permease subunit